MNSTYNKVLLVDDDIIAATIYQRTMRHCNFCNDIVYCSNGQQAKDHLLENDVLPDIIFLDINMHIMTGWEFLKWFEKWAAASNINLPVYVLSSSISIDDAEKAKKFSLVRDYITKPITVQHLKKIIAKK